jgi:DNA-binding Lrp family transcriptional regulator
MNTVKKKVTTQFDLTNDILNNLSQFNITPTAKLVLLYLTSCYNPKHAEIFPKQKTIAIKLGISERSVTRAIQELFNEGLLLIECKYTNRYKFTSRIISQQAEILSDDLRQNGTLKDDNLSHVYIEQKKETKKEQSDKLNRTEKTYSSNKGGNVYLGDDLILYEYAKKRAKYSVDAFIQKIKENGGADKIISEHKKTGIHYSEKRTDLLRSMREQQTHDRIDPNECAAWIEFGKKHGIKK